MLNLYSDFSGCVKQKNLSFNSLFEFEFKQDSNRAFECMAFNSFLSEGGV